MFGHVWIIYFAIFVLVGGHSILRNPQAWNTRESKARPCGNGNMPTTAVTGANKVLGGSTVSGMWEVTAGDGNGPVTITLAKTDAEVTSFSGDTIAIDMPTKPESGTGKYDFTFVAPAAGTCTGGADGQSCHLQFKSTSNWYSCMTLSLEAPTTSAPTLSPTVKPETAFPTASPILPTLAPTVSNTCSNVPQVGGYCSELSGKSVLVSLGSDTFIQAIQRIEIDGNFNRLNPLVFRNGGTSACQAAFERYWCPRALPSCTVSTVTTECKSACEAAMSECDLDPLHAKTFDCSQLTTTSSDAAGTCPADVPQRKIHLKNRYVGIESENWEVPPDGKVYIDMKLYEGDELTFKYDSGVHDVQRFPDEVAYDNCDFSGATVQDPTDGVFKWSYVGVGAVGKKLYFGSSMPSDACGKGQKVYIEIVDFPSDSVKVDLGADSTPEVVTGAPTPPPPDYVLPTSPNSSNSIAPRLVTMVAIVLSIFMASISY